MRLRGNVWRKSKVRATGCHGHVGDGRRMSLACTGVRVSCCRAGVSLGPLGATALRSLGTLQLTLSRPRDLAGQQVRGGRRHHRVDLGEGKVAPLGGPVREQFVEVLVSEIACDEQPPLLHNRRGGPRCPPAGENSPHRAIGPWRGKGEWEGARRVTGGQATGSRVRQLAVLCKNLSWAERDGVRSQGARDRATDGGEMDNGLLPAGTTHDRKSIRRGWRTPAGRQGERSARRPQPARR